MDSASAWLESALRFNWVNWEHIPALLSKSWPCVLAWTGIFALCLVIVKILGLASAGKQIQIPGKPRRYSAEYDLANRFVALLHAVYAVVISGFLVYTEGYSFGQPNTDLQEFVLVTSSSYFVYDYIFANIGALNNFLDNVHHFVTLLGLLGGLFSGSCGGELVLALFMVELSNPFYHTRAILLSTRSKGNANVWDGLVKICEVGFAVSFLFGRLVFGTWCTFRTVTCPTTHVPIKVAGFGLWAVCLAWAKTIAMVAIGKAEIPSEHAKKE